MHPRSMLVHVRDVPALSAIASAQSTRVTDVAFLQIGKEVVMMSKN